MHTSSKSLVDKSKMVAASMNHLPFLDANDDSNNEKNYFLVTKYGINMQMSKHISLYTFFSIL